MAIFYRLFLHLLAREFSDASCNAVTDMSTTGSAMAASGEDNSAVIRPAALQAKLTSPILSISCCSGAGTQCLRGYSSLPLFCLIPTWLCIKVFWAATAAVSRSPMICYDGHLLFRTKTESEIRAPAADNLLSKQIKKILKPPIKVKLNLAPS